MSSQVLDDSATTNSAAQPKVSWLGGIATVAHLELRQRVRSSRWYVVLGVWVVVLGALTLVTRWSVFRALGGVAEAGPQTDAAIAASAGRMVFSLVCLLVMSLGALVVPALSATSINGDRQAGILAILQTTLLSNWQIALGKLAAAWLVALALLGGATPFMLYAALQGGSTIGQMMVAWVVIALTLLVICAIGLGWSALTTRTSSSTLLTYLTTVALGVGLPLLFVLSIPLFSKEETITQSEPASYAESGIVTQCATQERAQNVWHSEKTWWLLAPSPYFVLGDAVPAPKASNGSFASSSDPLTVLRFGIRSARLGEDKNPVTCVVGQDPRLAFQQHELERLRQGERLNSSWAYGLACDLLLGALMLLVAARRLRTPIRNLPRGSRVA